MGDEKKSNEAEHINLKVMGQDCVLVQFRMKRYTPLSKLMKAYRKHVGLGLRDVVFRFDGNPVVEWDTPTTLDMKEGDTIQAYRRYFGGP